MSSMHEIVGRAIAGRAAVIAPADVGDYLYPVQPGAEVPLTIQRQLWHGEGRFYATGKVRVHSAWEVVKRPETPETFQLRDAYGLPIEAMYRRPEKAAADPFRLQALPNDPREFG